MMLNRSIKSDTSIVENPSVIKIEINTLIWMFCPGQMTIEEAEEMANNILEMFLQKERKYRTGE